MKHKVYGPYQVCTNDDSGLTLAYFKAISNLIHNVFYEENLVHFSINVKTELIASSQPPILMPPILKT